MSRRLPLPATNAKTAKSPRFVRAKLTAAVIAATQLILAGNTWAAPQGGQVVGGQGSIHQNGTDTRVNQASERMAIDWQSFDVGANERVEFVQPSSSSIALNRVLSNNASQILGRIDANGQVMLVNPNGVVFGRDSVINVGGLIASGLSIDPDSFINGDFTLNGLDGTDGKVINCGIINAATGGSVSLVGKQVENQGLISANLGAVNMAAGKQAVLTFDNAGLVGVKVTQAVLQSELGVDAAVVNSGEINAQGGRVLLTASQSEDIFSNAVNNGGMNRDQSVVVHDDGTFTLGEGADLVNTGEINTSVDAGSAGQVVMLGENIISSGQVKADATSGSGGAIEIHSRDTTRITDSAQVSAQAIASGKGGDIKLLGDKVGVFDNANVSTAGANGGGQLLVGGDKTGANKKIRNAEFIYIYQNALLDASATLNGNGGKLITFASDTARIYGYLKARGGALTGDGGFIETSGLLGFDILNAPDAGADQGLGGLWLIDPYNLTINNTAGGSISGGSFTSDGTYQNIKASTVETALASQDVTLITGGGAAGSIGNISVSQAINYTGSRQSTLTLQALNNIDVNKNITSSDTNGKLSLMLIADSDASGSGGITISDGVYISTRGGDFNATGTSFTGATSTSSVSHIYTGAYTQNGSNPSYANQAGDININVGTGDAVLGELNIKHNPSDAANSITAIGSITVNAGNISLLGYFNYNDSGSRSASGSSVINFTPDADSYSANNRNPFLKLVATNNISIENHIYEDYGDARDGLRIDLSAGNAITLGTSSKSVQIYTGGGNFIASSASFDSTYGSINTEDPNTQIAGAGNASAPNPKNDDPAGWSEGGDVSITADGTIILGSITTDGHATSGTPTGNLTITRKSNSASANLTQASGSSLNIFGISSFDLGSAGNITLNNAGNNFIGQLRITSANNVGISDADNYQYNLGGNTKQSVAHDVNLGASNIAGNFSLIANSDVSQTMITGEGLTVAGTTTINANTNDITLANVENSFIGTISVSNATDLTLKSAGGIIVNPLTIAAGGAGNIDLDVASGNISLQGTYDSSAGTEGNITLIGDVILTGDTTLNAGTSADADIRKVTITGTLDSFDTAKRAISITGNELSSQKDWGSIYSLGAVNLFSTNTAGASGLVSFLTADSTPVATNITATSFSLNSANSFYAGDIDVSETGGTIGIAAGNIEVGELNTSISSGSGGAITLTADSAIDDNKYIKINGDLNAQGSDANGDVQLTLANTSANGSVELNYADFFSSDITVTGNGARDTLVGLAKNSSWSITDAGTGTIVDADAISTATINFSGIENLTGNSADDTFTFTGSGSISGLVSAGAGTDLLDISALSSASTYAVAVNDATDATANLRVDGIELFKGNTSSEQELRFNSSTDDTVNWFIYKFTDSVLASADGNNDGVIVTATDTYKFTDFSVVTGGNGNDTFYFDRDEAITPNLTDASNQGSITNTINGGGGTNTLVGRNVDTLWSITGEYSGNTALLDTPASTYIASFSNIQSLLGTESKDTFAFSDSSKITSADGGATGDTNTADLSAINSDITVTLGAATDYGFSNISVLIGNASQTFTLAATSGTNTWTIKDFDGVGGSVADGVNDGTVGSIQFVDFKKLQGGSGIDTFNINSNFAGSIKGGDEADVFNISAAAGSLDGQTGDDTFVFFDGGSITSGVGGADFNTLDLHNLSSAYEVAVDGTTVDSITDIGRVIANSALEFTLKASTGVNTWTIYDFDGAGSVADGVNDGTVGTVQFVDFKNLQGGDGVDTFNINTDFSGSIKGGAEADVFNIRATAGSVVGEDGDDSFVFFDSGSLSSGSGNGGLNSVDLSNLSAAETVTLNGTTVKGVTGVGRVIANAGLSFTLQAASGTNTWTIYDFDGAGSVADGVNDGEVGGMQFVNFKNLQGGDGVDTFNINTDFSGSIKGGSEADVFNISAVVGSLGGEAGDDSFVFFDSGSLTSGVGGADTNILDLSNLSAAQTVSLNGNTVKGISDIAQVIANNSLAFTLQVSAGTNTWNIFDFDGAGTLADGVDDGTVGSVQFVNFTNLQGGSGVDTFNINTDFAGSIKGGDEADVFNISAAAGSLDGEAGADSFVFFDGGNLATGVGGTGTNILDLSNLSAAQTVTVNGSTVKDISDIARVIANNALAFTLEASSGANTWTISDFDNAGSVADGVNDGTVGTVQFVDFNSLQGGDGVDTFNINTNFAGSIKGGAEADVFNIRASAGALDGEDGDDSFVFFDGGSLGSAAGSGGLNSVDLSNLTAAETVTLNGATVKGVTAVGRVIANAGLNFTLQATGGTNTWDIYDFDGSGTVADGVNDGEVGGMQFVNFKNLQGGGGVDTFNINTNFSGTINGGDEADIFNLHAVVGNLDGEAGDDNFVFYDGGSLTAGVGNTGVNTIDLSNLSAAQTVVVNGTTVKGISEISRVIANNALDFTLQTTSGTNTWTISDFDDIATVADGVNDGTVGSVQFVDFKNLQGGSGVDTFNINTDFAGSIKGGDEADVFNISAAAGSLDGEAGDDSFVFFDGGSLSSGVGGTGLNAVDLSSLSIAETVELSGGSAKNVSNVGRIKANNALNFILKVASGTNTWTIYDFDGAGSVADGVNDGTVGTVQFVDFNNLQGGDGVDTFNINTNFAGSITGGAEADVFNIRATAGSVIGEDGDDSFVFFDGGSLSSGSGNGGLNSVDLSNLTAAETVTLNGTTVKGVTAVGRVIASAGLNFTLQATSGTNTWDIYDFDGSGTVADGVNDGTVGSVQFVNFKNLQGGSGVDTFNINTNFAGIINGGANNDQFNINAQVGTLGGDAGDDVFILGANGSVTTLEGGTDTDSLTGKDLNSTWNLTGSGSGSVALKGGAEYVHSFSQLETLNGGSQIDEFIVGTNGFISTINGGTGANALSGSSTNSTWTISSADQGKLEATAGGVFVNSFSGIQTLSGGSGIDIFNVNAAFTGTAQGGANNDIFNINASVNKVMGDAGDDSFILGISGSLTALEGGADTDSLTGKDLDSTWNLTGSGSGSVALKGGAAYVHSFSQIETLNGGNQADEFIIGTSGFINTIFGGTGANTLSGSSTNSTWTISSADQGKLEATAGGVFVNSFSGIQTLSGGSGIDIFNVNAAFIGAAQGGANNDIFNINASVNNVKGDAGDDSFILGTNGGLTTLEGGADNDSITGKDLGSSWNLTGSGSGSVALKGGAEYVHSFSQIETLNGGSQADEFVVGSAGFMNTILGGLGDNTLNGSDTDSTWTIGSADQDKLEATAGGVFVNSFSGIQTLSGGSGIDQFNFNAAFTGTAQGGANNDIFNINAAINKVMGDAGEDSFTLGTSGSVTTLEGGADSDSLTGKNLDSSWNLTGLNSGSVTLKGGAAYVTSFSQIETLNGGSQADEFVIGSAGYINHIIGGNGNNTLVAPNTDNNWNISGSDSGSLSAKTGASYVAAFDSIQNLTGNAALDKFTFASTGAISGIIDGGSSATKDSIQDEVDLKNIGPAVTLDLGGTQAGAVHIRNIEIATANSATSDQNIILGASDQTYIWTITGTNTGTIAAAANPVKEATLSFTNFGDLRGGTNNDTFNVTGGTAKNIAGGDGAGVDLVDYSDLSSNLIINLGSSGDFDSLGVNGIEGIKGNYGNNGGFSSTIKVADGDNTWVIGTDGDLGDGVNDGSVTLGGKVIYFENFTNINAGNGKDDFTYKANGQWLGMIGGGGGSNTIDASAATKNQIFRLVDAVSPSITQSTTETLISGMTSVKANAALANKLISADLANTWVVDAQGKGRLNDAIDFIGFSNLTGGAFKDDFILANINQFTGVIDAGGGVDSIDLTGVTKAISVSTNIAVAADLKIANVETLKANNSYANRLIAQDLDNAWSITGANSGSLNTTLGFSGFGILQGGSDKDKLVYASNAASLNGYINLGGGEDSLDTSKSSTAQAFYLRNTAGAVANGLALTGVETIIANGTVKNKLVGENASASWVVDGTDEGSVTINNGGTTSFTGIGNLAGGSANDTFTFGASGNLSGVIDGGDQTNADLVDLSKSKAVNILITATGDKGFRNIEKYIGNSISTALTADNIKNQWNLTGNNAGTLNQFISFENVVSLFGGNQADLFTINNASLTGKIDAGVGNDEFTIAASKVAGGIFGGAGNDTFNVQVASQDKGDLKLDGGADTNTLSVTGGQAGLVVNHQLDSFEYVAAAGNSLNIQFTGMSDLSDATVADMLNVYSSLESQDILLTNGQYQLGSAPVVYFANKDSFDLHAQASSKVSISGDFSFANSVILNNASINMDAGTISAHSLELINTQDVGKDAAIQTNVDDLTIRGANGVINIDELNALNIAELSAGSAQSMNISAGGDVTESQAIVYAKDLSLTSRTGDIVLAEDNRLDGKLSLNALGDINLRNADATHIAQLSAQNLTLNSTGAVDSTGSLQVTGKLQVQSANGVTLTDQNNNFGVVNINAQSVALFDKDGYLTQGVSASGNVDLGSAGGIDISSCAGQCGSSAGVSGGDISIHSASSAVNVNANIAASGTAAVSAVGINLADNLSANVINLNSGAGVVSAGAGTQLNAQDAIDVKGQSLAQLGSFAAGGDINVVTTGDITMGTNATTSTSSGDINYSGAALGLSLLQAGQGVVATNASKDIRDANGDSLNIQAVRWNASAQNGIGVGSLLNPSTQDAIETDIQEIAAINAGAIAGASPSSINIKQSDSLLVHRIINNGDISIELEKGDLVLSNRENNPFDSVQADARDQGGVINANRGQMGGTLAVDVKAGSIYAIFESNNDRADANNPDILAENGFFFYESGGTFALRNRKMVMGIHDNYRNEGKPRYVVWYKQEKPLHMDGSESTQTEDLSLQLIQIESLNEIDPAVFTNVRNYVSDEVAILMPPDQRFDSDDDEEGWANNTVNQ